MRKGKGGIMSICPSIYPHNWSPKCLSIYISISAILWNAIPFELSPMSTNAVKPELLHAFTTQGKVSPRHPRSLSLNPHIIPSHYSIHLFQIPLLHIPFLNRNPHQTIL